MKCAVVVNPITARSVAQRVERSLAERGQTAMWFETTPRDAGMEAADRAIERGAECVIVCGGDGTVRACSEALAGTGVALAIAPAGTGNLLARNLDPHFHQTDPVTNAFEGARGQIDVISVNGDRYEIMAGAGLDATMISETPQWAKNRFGSAAYVETVFKHLRDRPFEVEVTTRDTGSVVSGQALMILVANVAQIQAGVELASGVSPTDGLLDVIIVAPTTPIGLARLGVHILLKHGADADVRHVRAGACLLEFDHPLPYEVDGDSRPATRSLEFSVEPGALTVCLPRHIGQ